MTSKTTQVNDYVATLPADRRDAVTRVRSVINANLPQGYEECFQYGMISWCVSEDVLPASEVYNKQPLALVCLGSKKSYMALHMMSLYGDAKERSWFESAFKKAGKKLDIGKGCVRFGSIDALPLEVIGQAISHVSVEQYVDAYRKVHAKPAKKPAAKKPAAKKSAAKKSASKKSR